MTTPDIRLLDLTDNQEIPCPLAHDFPFGFSIALGNFDGVHAAHRKLITTAIEAANRLSANGAPTQAAVFFFRAPSGDYISHAAAEHLNTLEEKLCLFRSCKLRYAFVADFPSLKDFSACEFISEILQKACRAKAVSCGYNFRFGKNGTGGPELLQQAFSDTCTILPRQTICRNLKGGQMEITISSSTVRKELQAGNSLSAAAMLRYPYVISGEVIHGKKLGRELGFPTANLAIPTEKILPLCGVYASIVLVDGDIYFGVSNVGKRPTVDAPSSKVNCETNLLNFSGDLYGKEIRVFLLHYLRGETAFPDIAALQRTIEQDVINAQAILQDEKSCEFVLNIKEYFKKD